MTQQPPPSQAMSFYDVLEVSPRASAEVVRAAYKSLMQRHHPDKSTNPADSASRAALIAQAYAVLSDTDQRKAYDLRVAHDSLQSDPRFVTPYALAQRSRSTASQRLAGATSAGPSVYAWLLMLFIIVAGGAAISLSSQEKSAKAAPTTPDAGLLAVAAGGKQASLVPAGGAEPPAKAAAEDQQARTVPDLLTSLSIDLTPSATGTPRVLVIAQVGLRVDVADPGRWVQKIQSQRVPLVRALLDKLQAAQFDELVKPDGDLYLKRLIADVVVESIGIDAAAATPTPPAASAAVAAPVQTPRLVEVLLPQSFSLR